MFEFAYDNLLLIGVLGIVVYLTRIGGYLVLARIENIPPRLDAALQAVPAAVLATLVFPLVIQKGPIEIAAIAIVAIACLRLSSSWVLLIGVCFVITARQFTG